MKLAELFGTEIDFHTDLRKGDRFSVVFESISEGGVEISTGKILAAEFINRGKRHAVVLFREASGRESYYTPMGEAAPGIPQIAARILQGDIRICNAFSPDQEDVASAQGVDFGAATGTAVKATSDGKVDFVGVQRGYGNVIKLTHRNEISTVYAHLSRFASGLKKGEPSSRGDHRIRRTNRLGHRSSSSLRVPLERPTLDPMSADLPTAQPSPRQR